MYTLITQPPTHPPTKKKQRAEASYLYDTAAKASNTTKDRSSRYKKRNRDGDTDR